MPNLATTATYGTTKTLPYAEHWGLNGADVKSHIGAWNTPQFLASMTNLPVPLLRYAGGTSANTWRWRMSATDSTYGGYTEQGATTTLPGGKVVPQVLTLARFKQICDAAGAVPIFDLNIASDSTSYGWSPSFYARNAGTNKYGLPNLADQMAMLAAAASLGLPIKYVELGNELASFGDAAVKANYAYAPEGKSTINPATGVNYLANEIPAGYVYDRLNPVNPNINGENEYDLMLGKASTLPDTAFPEAADVPGTGAAGGGYLYGVRARIWCAAIKAVYPDAKVMINVPGDKGSLGPYNRRYWIRGVTAAIPTSGTGKPDILVLHPYHDGNNDYVYDVAENTPPPSIDPTRPGYSQTVVDNYVSGPVLRWKEIVDRSFTAAPGTDPTQTSYWYSLKPLLDLGMTVWNTEYGLLDPVSLTGVSTLNSGVDSGHGGWGQIISNISATLVRYASPQLTGMSLHSAIGNSNAFGALPTGTGGLTAKKMTTVIGGQSIDYPQYRFAGQDFPAPGPQTIPFARTANGQVAAMVSAAAKGATSVKPMVFSGDPKVNDTGSTASGVLGCTFIKSASVSALATNLRATPVDVTLPFELASGAYVIHKAPTLAQPIVTPADITSTTGTLAADTPTVTLPPYSVLRVSTTRTAAAMVADLNEPVVTTPVVTQVRLATKAEVDAAAAGVVRTLYPAFSASGTVAPVTGSFRFYVQEAWTIVATRASVGTAPAGSSLIVDVKKNGASIFATTTANRPTIAAASNTAVGGTPDTVALAAGDYLTVDVLQVGSSTAGSNLTVQVELQR